MVKLQIKSETIATFGGIFQIMELFERLGLGRLVDLSLGKRYSSWNAFQYSEVFETLFCNYLCGGDCLESIKKTSRLKKVLLHFICVPAKWIKSGRRNILKLYTERQYYKEIFSS